MRLVFYSLSNTYKKNLAERVFQDREKLKEFIKIVAGFAELLSSIIMTVT